MKRVLIALAVLVLIAAGAAAAWFWTSRHPGDQRGSPTKEFDTSDEPGTVTRPQAVVHETPWPTFGYDAARTRFAPEFHLRPPYEKVWVAPGHSVVEFPPVIADGRLYFGVNKGAIYAVDAKTGQIAWQRKYGRCIAASPTVGKGLIWATTS